MLKPLTRKTFEELIPAVATADQYAYYWGKFPDFLKRLLISVVSVFVIFLIAVALGDNGSGAAELIAGIIGGLHWLWWPVAAASFRNIQCRRYQYSGIWQGKVLDVFITDEVIGEEETVNSKGQLVIVENRERRLTVEVGDRTGFSTQLQVPLRKEHKAIAPKQAALMVVMSNQPDLSRIAKFSDIYIPSCNVWVSDYPILRRDEFEEIVRQLRDARQAAKSKKEPRGESTRRRSQRSRPRDEV